MRRRLGAALAMLAVAAAVAFATRARGWNDSLAHVDAAVAAEPLRIDDPHTPRLSRRVILVVIDGLGEAESHLPFLDELRARGATMTARTSYPSISRPNYVTILTGVPPRDSGIRTNSVREPPRVDTIMDRVHAAHLRATTASDYGSLASLFNRRGEVDAFDDVYRVDTLDQLAAIAIDLVRGDAAFVGILALDVDRAGHARGVGDSYRAAAAAVDRTLRDALMYGTPGFDLSRDTVIITADHGHVAPGGHGGPEPEVMQVPLILVGAGIQAGASARDARLVDVAPTVAALLGIPAPGHAEGRALVEVLRLPPADAARRTAADRARAAAVVAVADAAASADDDARPDLARLAIAGAVWAAGAALALLLHRRTVIALGHSSAAGGIAFAAMLVAQVVILRARFSASYVPALSRAEVLGIAGVIAAIAVHVLVMWRVLRRAPDRVAAGLAMAIVGLTVSLGTVFAVRAWWSPPFVDVPSPFWFVAIPAFNIAAATSSAAIAVGLALVVARGHRGTR
jgi:hypothetical protein